MPHLFFFPKRSKLRQQLLLVASLLHLHLQLTRHVVRRTTCDNSFCVACERSATDCEKTPLSLGWWVWKRVWKSEGVVKTYRLKVSVVATCACWLLLFASLRCADRVANLNVAFVLCRIKVFVPIRPRRWSRTRASQDAIVDQVRAGKFMRWQNVAVEFYESAVSSYPFDGWSRVLSFWRPQ